jgi:hypothetical protein
MWSRRATRLTAAAALLAAALGGCSDIYFERRDGISVVSGEAQATNRVTQMIDPWPAASGRRNIAYSGEKAAIAAERYRTGRVIPPVNATTSSAGYSQVQQAVQSAVSSQASSASSSK